MHRARWLFRGHPERRYNRFAPAPDRLAPLPSLYGAMSDHEFIELDPAKRADYELCCLVIDATIAYRQESPLPVVPNVDEDPAPGFQARKVKVTEAYQDLLGLFQEGPGKARLKRAWGDWGSRHALAFEAVVPHWILTRSPILFAYLKTLDELIRKLNDKHWEVLGIQEEIKNQEENQNRRQRLKHVFQSQKTPGPKAIVRACAECAALLVRLFPLTFLAADSHCHSLTCQAGQLARTPTALLERMVRFTTDLLCVFPATPPQLDQISITASQLRGAVPTSLFPPVVRATKIACLGILCPTMSVPNKGPTS